VQVTLTVPVPLSAVVAFAETGSYATNATGAVAMVQFAVTDAVTARFDVATAASAAGSRANRQYSRSCCHELPCIELAFEHVYSKNVK